MSTVCEVENNETEVIISSREIQSKIEGQMEGNIDQNMEQNIQQNMEQI